MSDSLGLGGGSGDSGAVDDIDNVDDGDFNADLNTDDDVGNGSFAYFLAADQVDGDTIGDRGNGDGVSSERIAGSQTISVNCECSWWDHIACIGCNQLTIDHSQIRAGCELTSLRGCGLDSQEEWSRLGTGWGCGRRC